MDSIYEDVSYAMEKENFDVNYIVSGKPVLDSSLNRNEINMICGCLCSSFNIYILI